MKIVNIEDNNNNYNNKFKTLKCAPKRIRMKNKTQKNYTCYNNEELFHLRNIYNHKNPKNKILTNNTKKIWKLLKKKLRKTCKNELCWKRKLNFINNNEEIFRPFSPKSWQINPYEWLNSEHIKNVMKQYETSRKNFKFIGPSPIDFDYKLAKDVCVCKELCNFNLLEYYNSKPKIDKIGIIFNLDKHDMRGSHWTSLFIDLENKFLFYLDSNGLSKYKNIPKEVRTLIKNIKKQGNKLNTKLDVYFNKKEHQKKDGQCGMYTLYFIVQLLKGTKTPKDFIKSRVTDEEMKDYRLNYFNEEL